MPCVDTILRRISAWKWIVTADISQAYHQIPLSQESLKYAGVCTPFKGARVYTTAAMGMPGSEVASAHVSPVWANANGRPGRDPDGRCLCRSRHPRRTSGTLEESARHLQQSRHQAGAQKGLT